MTTKRTVKPHFYWNLREIMKFKHITFSELSIKTGINSLRLLSYWNNDKRPSNEHVISIAKALKCDVNDLLTGYDLHQFLKTETDEICKPEIEINYPTLDNFDIHKFIDECMSKKDRSVSIYFSTHGVSVSVYPLEEDEAD